MNRNFSVKYWANSGFHSSKYSMSTVKEVMFSCFVGVQMKEQIHDWWALAEARALLNTSLVSLSDKSDGV